MVKEETKDNKKLFQCEECKFFYEDKDWGDPPKYGGKMIFSDEEMKGLVKKIQKSINIEEMHKYRCKLR